MSPDLEAQEMPDPVSGVPVLLAGIATTAATLAGVYFLNRTGFYLMGFLIWAVVPAWCCGPRLRPRRRRLTCPRELRREEGAPCGT